MELHIRYDGDTTCRTVVATLDDTTASLREKAIAQFDVTSLTHPLRLHLGGELLQSGLLSDLPLVDGCTLDLAPTPVTLLCPYQLEGEVLRLVLSPCEYYLAVCSDDVVTVYCTESFCVVACIAVEEVADIVFSKCSSLCLGTKNGLMVHLSKSGVLKIGDVVELARGGDKVFARVRKGGVVKVDVETMEGVPFIKEECSLMCASETHVVVLFNNFKVFDIESGACTKTFPNLNHVLCIAVCGRYLMVGSMDGIERLDFESDDSALAYTSNWPTAFFHINDNLIASKGLEDEPPRFWSLGNGLKEVHHSGDFVANAAGEAVAVGGSGHVIYQVLEKGEGTCLDVSFLDLR